MKEHPMARQQMAQRHCSLPGWEGSKMPSLGTVHPPNRIPVAFDTLLDVDFNIALYLIYNWKYMWNKRDREMSKHCEFARLAAILDSDISHKNAVIKISMRKHTDRINWQDQEQPQAWRAPFRSKHGFFCEASWRKLF